jgi:hypothetical protein
MGARGNADETPEGVGRRARPLLCAHADLGVAARGNEAPVTEPASNYLHFHLSLEELHDRRVAEDAPSDPAKPTK